LRIVLDATVLVRAHPRSRSAGRKALRAVIDRRHTLLLSNEIIVETTKVLRYPRLQRLHALTEDELYDYVQFLQNVSETVILDRPYHAPLRDPNDLDVMQTAEHGEADVLCSNDGDFHEPGIIAYCAARGIHAWGEAVLLAQLL
jgi:putative PIN family toxin of toxin-antitoxin system